MNKKYLFLGLGAVVLGIVGVAAYKFFMPGTGHLKLIPKDASVVMTIDFKSLAKKMDYDGKLKQTTFYRDILESQKKSKSRSDDSVAQAVSDLLQNPLSSGVNVFSDIYFFQHIDGKISYTGIVLDLNSISNWETTLKKLKIGDGKLKKGDNYMCQPVNESMVLAWNDKGLLILYRPFSYSMFTEENPVHERMEKIVGKYMHQTKDESILAVKEFGYMNADKNDMSVYVNYSAFNKGNKTDMFDNSALVLMRAYTEKLDGLYTCYNLNFEDNGIVLKGQLYGDEKKLAQVQFLKDKGISDESLQYITGSGKVLGATSINLDMKKIMALFTGDKDAQQGLEDMAENLGLKKEQLEQIFNGEITFALTDIQEVSSMEMTYDIDEATGQFMPGFKEVKKPCPMMTLHAGIANRQYFDSFAAHTYERSLVNGRAPFPMMSGTFVQFVKQPKHFFVSNDTIMAGAMLQGKVNNYKPIPELADEMKSNGSYMYLDLNLSHYPKVFTDFMQGSMGESAYGSVKEYMSILKDVKALGSGNAYTFSINLQEGKGNSLYRLIEQADRVYAKQKTR